MNDTELMARYGRLVIQAEILQGQIQEVKKLIAEQLNKKEEKKAE